MVTDPVCSVPAEQTIMLRRPAALGVADVGDFPAGRASLPTTAQPVTAASAGDFGIGMTALDTIGSRRPAACFARMQRLG